MRCVLLLAATACTHAALPAPTVTKETPASPDLDLLLVIEDSSDNADKQTIFGADFPGFVASLDALPGGRPNLHVGVIDSTVDLGVVEPGCPSPDPDDNGLLQSTARVPGCTAPSDRYISDLADGGTRTTNYTGTLDTAMACIAEVGDGGCGYRSPLLAAQRALDGTRPENAGFLRPGAALALVFLARNDDCSVSDPSFFAADPQSSVVCAQSGLQCAQPISAPGTYTDCTPRAGGPLLDLEQFQQTLATLKDPLLTAVTTIAGTPSSTVSFATSDISPLVEEDSCMATINGDPTGGEPAVRLAAFTANLGGTFASICQSDYSTALKGVADRAGALLTSCLPDGVAPTQCSVEDRASDVATSIPNCPMIDATTPDPMGPRPCWWVARDATCSGGELLHVERNAPAAEGTVVVATCAKQL